MALDLAKAAENVFIRGDNAVARTFTIGQTVTVKDVLVIDTDKFSVTAAGATSISGLITAVAGIKSPTDSSSVSNEAYGDGALASIISGFGNNAVGKDALGNLTIGSNNMGYGLNAGSGIIAGDSNVFVGPNTGTRGDVTESTGIGVDACAQIIAGPNFGIGFRACKGDNAVGGSGTNNWAAGNRVLQVFTTGINNWGAGNDALQKLTIGNNNFAAGRQALQELISGNCNTALGAATGRDVTGSDNTLIGAGVANTETAISNVLRIHNAGGTAIPIIEGLMGTTTNQVGINTKTLNAKLNIVAGDTDNHDVVELTQNDDGQRFVNFAANSGGDVSTPLTTLTAGNTIQGFVRVSINGTLRWMPFYDNPTS